MNFKLPDIVFETIIKALQEGILIQKQARLCDLVALDFIPTEILSYLKLYHQKAIAKFPTTLLLNCYSVYFESFVILQ